jgi:hypothetical protein
MDLRQRVAWARKRKPVQYVTGIVNEMVAEQVGWFGGTGFAVGYRHGNRVAPCG